MASGSAAATGTAALPRASVTFVTGNAKKLEEVRAILGPLCPVEVVSHALDLPELQGEPEFVASEKCKLAAARLGCAVMTEDTSLCFNALGGLPGVYIKWFLEKLGHAGLNRILAGWDDKTAYAQCIFAYSSGPGAEPRLFVGRTHGRIVPARGPADFGWDPVFQPDEAGGASTYAEMDKSVKNSISHRSRALAQLLRFLTDGTGSGEPPLSAAATV